jgi:hypothetical protein
MPKRPTAATAAGCEREAALNSIFAFIDSLDVAVVLIRGKGRSARVKVPRKPTVRDQEASCRDDLLAVLSEAGRRLTGSEILNELSRRHADDRTHWLWSERTVMGCLADMVESGIITNDPDARPRGYMPAPSLT